MVNLYLSKYNIWRLFMKIYLFLSDRLIDFSLPLEIEGSFSFDPNFDEEAKLINVEARDDEWVIYSTDDSKIINNNIVVGSATIMDNSFYVLRRNGINYLIYVSNLLSDDLILYSFNKDLNLIIGNIGDCNIIYSCNLFNGIIARIHYVDNNLVIENNNSSIYVNNKMVNGNNFKLSVGDKINIFGIRILLFDNMFIINIPGGVLNINEISAGIAKYNLVKSDDIRNISIKDVDLYDKNSYFSKSPRIRRVIETKEIKLSPPPQPDRNQELPLILTIGPMLTMGITSLVMFVDTINRINRGETTFSNSWTSLVSSGAMLISMLMWPVLINFYNKRMKKKRREEIVKKYGEYLDEKREELRVETKLQRDILIENLITTDECLNIIKNRGINFWDKRVDQSDFLVVRIGMGNELLDAKVEYPEEGFTVDEDELRKQADKMVEEFKYIENVPVSYSFYDNRVTAIMGVNRSKSLNFVNNIILQLITFYSYEDLKLVLFTNEDNEIDWDYLRYLNHTFTNERNFRFFSSAVDSAKSLADFLNMEISNRLGVSKNNKDNNFKPYYIIIIDDYSRVKKFEFIKTLTESEENLGFSVLFLENRLSKLPSKCNNFISLGTTNSGVLKNSYEKQEQIIFRDEINYNINMMNISKILSNIPIEFEEGMFQLPDAISFMEMERVGKVEQLNILNRWNTNDPTNSLRAEVGVDEQGELMYLDLHEKYHGPHGLIAGTTGSGKSEFIITYILSMCINYSPDDVAFILIDYKGGGLALAFENKVTGVRLPHLAGTITNLDKAEMDRTLVSIDSEVKRRQRMFNEARDKLEESTIDIYKYQRFYQEGKVEEAIPHLFIICDEFAELKSQQPDFMDNLISVARIGRSLGVHLILATQKPSGVVNDQIWSNTKFRVCLKVQDESDSKEMLKRPEAAHITQAGRFYLQVGYDEIFSLGQSGWCGAKYYPSEKIVKQVDKSVNFIDDCGNFIKSIQATNAIKIEAQGEQLSAIMKSIIETADKVGLEARRLWLDNIPSNILVDNLEKKYSIVSNKFVVDTVIGEYDAPEKQEQGIVKYNYLVDGNTIVYGNDGGERELFLSTLIYSTVKNHMADEVNFYFVDYGSEQLRRYLTIPHVGGMVFAGEDEKFNNLLKLVKEEFRYRKKLFIDYGGEYANYVRGGNNNLPLMVIIMNNYDSIYEANQNLYDELPDLVRDSSRYGIIFILTANAVNSVSTKISQNFSNIYAFKLKDATDYVSIFNTRTKVTPRDIFGRGLLKNDGVHEFQTANIVENADDLNDYLSKFIVSLKQSSKVRAKRIPTLPDIVRLNDVSSYINGLKSIPVGISKNDLEVVTIDYLANTGNIISSNKIQNTEKFVRSLLFILRNINNCNLIIIDSLKELMLDTQVYSNYYNDNFDSVLEKLVEFLDKLLEAKSTNEGVIVIYGIYKLVSKLENTSKLEELIKKIKKYENFSIILIDDANKIKGYQFESWFSSNFSTSDGIWIGKGISNQSLLRLSTITREMTRECRNDMGYVVSEGSGTLVRFIDFVTKDDGDTNGK